MQLIFLGSTLLCWGEKLLSKIPLVRSIYNATKQVMQAIFATNSEAFRKVLLIEYPRKDTWTLAFQTGTPMAPFFSAMGEEMLSVFVPTTPNPTAGFLLMLPKKDAVEIEMSIDEALKFIISLGVMQPLFITNKLINE